MIESTWAKAWAMLCVLYPQAKQASDANSEVAQATYWAVLHPYMDHEIENAVGVWLRKSRWFPAVSDLVDCLSAHRGALGGDWDTVERGLLCEASGVPFDRLRAPEAGSEALKVLDAAAPGWREIGGVPDDDEA